MNRNSSRQAEKTADAAEGKRVAEMESKEENHILYVQMFGSFSLTWKGKPLIGASKSNETQFAYLMQQLLHNRENGVSREQLGQILFGDRDVSDLNHAMRSVIYNAKKKLKAAGMPDVNYIEQRKGVCFWTKEIPVQEDASEMERLCQEAREEEDPRQKLELYLEACHCYTGEFLGFQASSIWAARESRRYRRLFCSCVEEAVRLLRENEDYYRMEKIGLYAAKVNPLADWETVTMEALVGMEKDEEAVRFYDDTVELYLQEQGLRPSDRLLELLNKLGTRIEHQYEVLDLIQMQLTEGEVQGSGGYECSYPVFQGVYRMVERMMERGGQSVYLMLCTVVDSKGNPMKDGAVLSELSERLKESIRQSVRRGDAFTRYGKGQYLVLLINTTRENCKILQRRINERFVVRRQRTGVQYHVNSVACTPQGDRLP